MSRAKITGITRVRNESLILEDTLNHFLGYCNSIILYDDASTDNTVEIAESFDRVRVIRGRHWRRTRAKEETRHRALLLEKVGTAWTLCFDADERLEGPLPDLTADGYRFRLFDAYMTPDHQEPYSDGRLSSLPRLWGAEYRDILMLFRTDCAAFRGLDRREPIVKGNVQLSDILVRHYGKCLSIEHWEETADYYSKYFPHRKDKWEARKGKAIHTRSDFDRPLFTWEELMNNQDEWVSLCQ